MLPRLLLNVLVLVVAVAVAQKIREQT